MSQTQGRWSLLLSDLGHGTSCLARLLPSLENGEHPCLRAVQKTEWTRVQATLGPNAQHAVNALHISPSPSFGFSCLSAGSLETFLIWDEREGLVGRLEGPDVPETVLSPNTYPHSPGWYSFGVLGPLRFRMRAGEAVNKPLSRTRRVHSSLEPKRRKGLQNQQVAFHRTIRLEDAIFLGQKLAEYKQDM